jgi:sec-independent protein translocase protein TatC
MTASETTAERTGEPDDGRMPLAAHLRELRSRMVKSFIAIAIVTTISWFFYDQLFELIQRPLDPVIANARAEGKIVALNFADITSPFMTKLKISLIAGVIISSPIWIYQVWRFLTPGLHRHEKRWALLFAGAAVPLAAMGIALGYYVLPKGLALLLGFAPEGSNNILTVDRYLSFFTQIMIVFGVSFLAPVFIVALNVLGILSAQTLKNAWRWIVMAVFLFSAVATPSQDPMTMLALAAPMLILIFGALGICWLNDRRRARRQPQWGEVDDDEASDIAVPEPIEQPVTVSAPEPVPADEPEDVTPHGGPESDSQPDDDWT